MNVLISGASGFVGSCLARYLEECHSIKSVGLISSSLKEELGCSHKSVIYSLDDALNGKICTDIIYDVYVHAASAPRSSGRERYNINISLLAKSLSMAASLKIRQFVYLSSGAVYKRKITPYFENDDLLTPGQRDGYGEHKVESERLVVNFCVENNIHYSILRLFSFIGWQISNRTEFAFASFLKQAKECGEISVKSPNTVRSYLSEFDLARDISLCFKNKNCYDSVFNIGSSEEVVLKDLAKKIAKPFNAAVKFEKEASALVDFYVPNIDKINKISAVKRMSLDDSLALITSKLT